MSPFDVEAQAQRALTAARLACDGTPAAYAAIEAAEKALEEASAAADAYEDVLE